MNKTKNKFNILIAILAILLLVCMILIGRIQYMKEKYETRILQIQKDYELKLISMRSYEYLYKENEKDLIAVNREKDSLKKEYTEYKQSIAIARANIPQTLSRGETARNDLRQFRPITKDELNEWIKAKAPKDSPFIGRADVFIRASQVSGLDPKYIVSHAAIESDWGKSQIARDKGNYFGISCYNDSPYESSQNFSGGLEGGIINGAKWISNHYTNKGQSSVSSMIYGNRNNIYAQNNDGSPNEHWLEQITSVMASN